MYSVMIVDDEYPARELIKLLPCFNGTTFRIEGVAQNGAEALELFKSREFDLVITDIQMPVMDGLELIRQIRQLNKNQNVVILSCHESFVYAQEAIRLGISDYLIKDSLTNEQVSEVLLNIFDASDDGEPSKEGGTFFCICLVPDVVGNLSDEKASEIAKAFKQVIDGELGGEVTQKRGGEFELLCCASNTSSELFLFNQRHKIAQSLRVELSSRGYKSASMGLSPVFSDVVQAAENFELARQACRSRVFQGRNKTIYYDVIHSANKSNLDVIAHRLEQIEKELNSGDFRAAAEQITGLLSRDYNGIAQYNYVEYVNANLFELIFSKGIESGANLQIPKGIMQCRDAQKLLRVFLGDLDEIERAGGAQSGYSHRIKKVYEYIIANYSADISLSTIAEQFDIHKVHLARTFKEETGMSLNRCILDLRMKKAQMLLLKSDLRINEVATQCGFNNTPNFNTAFKKHQGITPSEFRNAQAT